MHTILSASQLNCRDVLPPVQPGRSGMHAMQPCLNGMSSAQHSSSVSRLLGGNVVSSQLGLNIRSLHSVAVAAAANNGGEFPGDHSKQPQPVLLTREDLVKYLQTARLEDKQRSHGPQESLSSYAEQQMIQRVMDLDEDQWDAVASKAQYVQVIAGPGAGKTLTLLTRVFALLAAGAEPEEIVVVAFTNNAASELRERCSEMVGEGVASALNPGTIHALCRQVLREYGTRLNLPIDFDGNFTADKITRREIIIDVMIQQGLLQRPSTPAQRYANKQKSKEYSDLISRLKNFEEHIDGPTNSGAYLVAKHYQRPPRSRTKPAEDDLALVYDAYQAMMAEKRIIDYDDELHLTLTLIRRHADVLEETHQRWRHILIDETQDLNKCQHALFQAFTGPKTTLFLVGDPDQSIYGFRGASADKWNDAFDRYSSNGHTTYLNNNYRSKEGIVFAADQLREISRNVCSGHLPLQKRISTRSESASPSPAATTVVEMRYYETASDEIAALVSKLQHWHDLGYDWKRMAVLAQSVKSDTIQVSQEILAENGIPIHLVLSEDDKDEQQWLEEDRLELYQQQSELADPPQNDRQQPRQQEGSAAAEDNDHNAVQLMTIHVAKGKEFPCVAIASSEALYYYESYFSKQEKLEDIRQSYNQAYVGVSRAQDQLYISWSYKDLENVRKKSAHRHCIKPFRELAGKLMLHVKRHLLGISVVS